MTDFNFFEDPEWGNTKEFSYDTSRFTFKVPSSVLENIQESQDRKKDKVTEKRQQKKKRKIVEELASPVISSNNKKKKSLSIDSPTKVLGKASISPTSESSQKISSNCKDTINDSKIKKILENGSSTSEEKQSEEVFKKTKQGKHSKRNKYRELNILQQAKKNDLLVEKGGIEGLSPVMGSASAQRQPPKSDNLTVVTGKSMDQDVSKTQNKKRKKKLKAQSKHGKDESEHVSENNLGSKESNCFPKHESKDTKDLGKVSQKKKHNKEKRKKERDLKSHNNDTGDDVEDNKVKQDLDNFMQNLNFENLKESNELSSDNESDCITNISDSEEEYLGDEIQDDRKGDIQRDSDTAVCKVGTKNKKVSNATHLGVENVSHSEEERQFSSDKMILTKLSKQHSSEKNVKRRPLNSAEALKEKMEAQLNAARFRLLNEQMYTTTSSESSKFFKTDKAAFSTYHGGFQLQVSQWPVNPLDVIIKWLKNKPKHWIVADFGCGDALLAASVPQTTVHSFDFVALNSRVTACDMSHTPLRSFSVDVVVFCLSLMGTNIKDFILEAGRVLKKGGILRIAEVQSRFKNANDFMGLFKKYGFQLTFSEMTTKYFYMFEFKKQFSVKSKSLPDIVLNPCIYKKR